MHLYTDAVGVLHHSHIACDDSRNAGTFRRIDYVVHQRHVVVVHHRIDSQIRLDAMFVAHAHNFTQIVGGKVGRRPTAHIQFLDAEIDRIGTGFDGCGQTLPRTDRRHYFKIAALH